MAGGDTITDDLYKTLCNVQSAPGVVPFWIANTTTGAAFYAALSPVAAMELAAFLNLHAANAAKHG